jgi:hypothetical protein
MISRRKIPNSLKMVIEFTESLQVIPNGTDAEMYNPLENPELTQDSENRQFVRKRRNCRNATNPPQTI